MLGELIREVRVGKWQMVGRPKKKWSECVMDRNLLRVLVEVHVVQDQQMWKAVESPVQLILEGKIRTLIENDDDNDG